MSIDNPPIYSGITYNSQFFDDNTGGLTQAQANALYLRKTVTDTATALETFNSGVATASINSTSSATNMTIGSNLAPTTTLTLGSTGTITTNNGTLQSQSLSAVNSATNMNIGASHGSSISIGQAGVSTTNLYGTNQAGTIDAFTTTGTLNLGQNLVGGTLNVATGSNVDVNVGTGTRSTAVVHNYSDGDNCIAGSNVHLNNGINNLSNTNIHNGAGSGGLVQIGTGATSTTAVSIATRGASSTNAVRIGNVSNTTYLDSDSVNVGALGLTGSGAISIATGTNTAGAQVSIGSTSLSAVNIKGVQTNFETTTLNLNTNGVGNTLIGTSGGSNSITINRPLTPAYSLSFTSGQIGYSSSSTASGSLVSGTYNNLIMPAMTGVYIVSSYSYVAAGSFVGITTYDFQVGLNGIGDKSRIYLGGTNSNYANQHNTLPMLYSSSGPTNTGSAVLYSNVSLTFASFTGIATWLITISYTRVA
jgi:hypothetical protein